MYNARYEEESSRKAIKKMSSLFSMQGSTVMGGKVFSSIFEFDEKKSYIIPQDNTLKFINSKDDLEKKLKELGPDMFEKETTFEIFKKAVKAKGKWNITKVLMDQKIISGVGNYMRADILYLSKISPFREISSLDNSDLKNIYKKVEQ